MGQPGSAPPIAPAPLGSAGAPARTGTRRGPAASGRVAGRSLRAALPTWLAINVAVAMACGHRYVTDGVVVGDWAWLYAHLTFAAALLAVATAGGAVLALLSLLPGGRGLSCLVAAGGAGTLLAFLWVDGAAFRLYRFHVGGLTWDVLRMPDGLEALGVWPSAAAGLVGATLVVMLLDAWLLVRLAARAARDPARMRNVRRDWGRLLAVTAIAVTGERAAYAAADAVGHRDVVRASHVVPFYPSLVGVDLAKRVAMGAPRRDTDTAGDPVVQFAPDAPRWNVLWLVLDSWRADAMSPSLTPVASALGERSTVFHAHVSGGDATRWGLVSMLYGLPAATWSRLQLERRSPPLLAVLRNRGWQLGLFTSIDNMPDIMSVVFADIPPSARFVAPPARLAAKDRATIGALERFLDTREPDRPYFAFVHLLSTHFGYDPSCKLPRRARNRRDRYERAVQCADRLVARALRRVSLRDTIVVVTADHGEAFGEGGVFGHAVALTMPELRVPLVLHVPGRAPADVHHPTSHHDMAATILDALGATMPTPAAGVGHSLLRDQPIRPVFACNANECAIHDPDGSVRFGIGARYPRQLAIRDAEGRPLATDGDLARRRFAQVVALLQLQSDALP